MWILLLLAIGGLWIFSFNLSERQDWRLAFVMGLVFFQTYLVMVTELLSFFEAVTPLWLSLAWGLLIVGIGVWYWFSRTQKKCFSLPKLIWPKKAAFWIVDGIIVFILITTLIIAVTAPPNTADAMVYHMPRIAHWAQERAVVHYPTGVEHANTYPPGAEMQMLHFYILFGGDRLVNLQGWLAFLGAIMAVTALSRVIGLGETGMHFSGLFTATIPLALAHASGPKNDLAVAFWVVSVILMAFVFLRRGQQKRFLVILALAVSLSMLTKHIAAIFLAPFAVWFVIALFRNLKWTQVILWGCIIVIVALSLNIPSLIRNLNTFGDLSDTQALNHQRTETISPVMMILNFIRHISLHAQTPWPWSRAWIFQRMIDLHDLLGVDPNDPRITVESDFEVPGLITSEVVSGNPLHLTLALVSVLLFWGFSLFGDTPGDVLVLSITGTAAFLLFSTLIKWQVFGARYHLAFFLMIAPIPAYWFDLVDPKGWISAALGGLMLGLASLWLFSLQPRPMVVWKGMTRDFTIFEDREGLYYPGPFYQDLYQEMDRILDATDCRTVGLRLRGSSMEYLYWVALGLPGTDYRLENLVAGTPSALHRDPNFAPCAVICEDCPNSQQYYDDLPLFRDFTLFKLYLQPYQETENP